MNWGRYLRAAEVQRIRRIEQRREVGIEDPKKLSDEEWLLIQAHDNLVEQYG